MHVVDTLVNFFSRLGTSSDKRTHHQYTAPVFTKEQQDSAYRGDWIARKCVDIPAKDSTRAWRSWQAEQDAITRLEETEKSMRIQLRTKQAMQKARLYGGGALIIGLDDSAGAQDQPLEIDRVKEGSLKFVHAVSRWEINAGEIELDITSPNYGEPKWYERSATAGAKEIRIHSSRVVRFHGNEVLDPMIRDTQGWGDSVLQAVDDAIRTAAATLGNVAALVEESKFDIIRIPELMKQVSTKAYEDRLIKRFTLSNNAKSIINALLLDKDEEWSREVADFTGLPDVAKLFLLVACGAVDIPATRFLSQSPAGMNATGDSDTRNYYDMLSSGQNTEMTPALSPLDEVLIRTSLGSRDPAIHYEWNELWQLDEVQKATRDKAKADTYKIDVDAALINPDALREARVNQLVEDGTYPGLEGVIEEFGSEPDIPEGNFDPLTGLPLDPTAMPPGPGNTSVAQTAANENALFSQKANKKAVGDALSRKKQAPLAYRKRKAIFEARDAQPRTLYIYRSVNNAKDIVAHYEKQGVKDLFPAKDLHVTIAYSREPVDWMKVGSDDWSSDKNGNMSVKPGGARLHEQLGGEKVLCLMFASNDLTYRHMRTRDAGCDWAWDDYQPHIAIAPAPVNPVDIKDFEPWTGPIDLGPEVFEEVNENWALTAVKDGWI